MKKVLAVLLMVALSVTMLVGCTDATYDDFENYLNVEMVEVNADYAAMTEKVAAWETLEDDAALAKNIKEEILPLVDGMLEKLQNVNPATEEVKALKATYVKMVETYKEGFEGLYEACETQNAETNEAANAKLAEAVELLNEYNAGLDALAAEYGSTIEY